MRLLLNSYLYRITIMQTCWSNNKRKPQFEKWASTIYSWLLFVCLLYHFCLCFLLFFSTFNTKLRVDGLIFATFQLKIVSLVIFLFSVLLLLIRLLLPSLFLEAPACETLLIFFFRNPKEMYVREKNERTNESTQQQHKKKNGQRDAVLCFIELLPGSLVLVCVYFLLSFGLPHLIGI